MVKTKERQQETGAQAGDLGAGVQMVKVARLLLDYNIYPRHRVDSTQVKNIAMAWQAGEVLPAVVANRKDLRVVDGFHRVGAARLLKRDDIEVRLDDFADEAAMILESFRLNSKHGQRLSAYDRTRCALLAQQHKISVQLVAAALCVPVSVIVQILPHKTARNKNGTVVPIKRVVQHMAGRNMTEDQQAVMKGLGGNSQLFCVNQLIRLIEAELLDRQDAPVMAALKKLHTLLGNVVLAEEPEP